MVSRVTCPNGHVNIVPVTLSDVVFGDNAMNLAVTCQACGQLFDAAPSGSADTVRVDTLPDGSLSVQAVVRAAVDLRDVLADLTADELLAVRLLVDDVAAGTASPEEVGRAAPALEKWVKDNPVAATALAGVLGPVLAAIIAALLSMWTQQGAPPAGPVPPPPPNVTIIEQFPSDEYVEDLVRKEVEDQQRGRRQ